MINKCRTVCLFCRMFYGFVTHCVSSNMHSQLVTILEIDITMFGVSIS